MGWEISCKCNECNNEIEEGEAICSSCWQKLRKDFDKAVEEIGRLEELNKER